MPAAIIPAGYIMSTLAYNFNPTDPPCDTMPTVTRTENPTVTAKKKPSPQKLTPFIVRLYPEYRVPLKELAAKNRRPIVGEIALALDAHLKAHGVTPPGR